MSLSEDERKELEKLRAEKESKEKYTWAATKGIALGITSYQVFSYFTPDTVFGRSVRIFGMLVCFAVGILSSYYGPFKKKKEAEF